MLRRLARTGVALAVLGGVSVAGIHHYCPGLWTQIDRKATELVGWTEEARDADREQDKVASSAQGASGTSVAAESADAATPPAKKAAVKKRQPKQRNNVRKLRTERMMSKAELARRAGLSTLTVDRVEKGMPCRMDTKRKILEALGLTPSDRVAVFGEED